MRYLSLADNHLDEHSSMLFGEALREGALHRLESLLIGGQMIHPSVWEAYQVGSCPDLKELDLERSEFDSDGATALVSAIASGALANIQVVNLMHTFWEDLSDVGTVAVVSTLASSCHDLCDLSMSLIYGENDEATQALLDALREGKCQKLETLDMPRYPDWCGELADVLEGGAGANLKDLHVSFCSVATMKELVRVLIGGACPKLRSLVVNISPFDDSVAEQEYSLDDMKILLKERGIKVRHH